MTNPFASLETYIGLSRVEALALSPDGSRAVLTVATLSADRTKLVRSLWAVPTHGDGPPVRLTRSAKGEAGVAFTPGGDVLFVSGRPDGPESKDDAAQLWSLSAGGGEARAVTRLAGGVSGIVAVASASERVIITAELLPSSASLEQDMQARAARRTRKLSAILHETYPVRFWDEDLGPGEPHLLALDLTGLADVVPDAGETAARAAKPAAEPDERYPAQLPRPLDLVPQPGRSVDFVSGALAPDGLTLLASLQVPRARGGRSAIAAIDTLTGERRILFDDDGIHSEDPVLSHGGELIAFLRTADDTPVRPADRQLWIAQRDGSGARRLAAEWDRWVSEMCFTPSDDALIVIADHDGRAPIFRIPLDGGPVVQLTHDAAAFTNLAVDRRSGTIVALRSDLITAPHPVRIDPDGSVTRLSTPVPPPAAPARLEEIETTAADGTRVRAWLVLPVTDDPAPLLLWIHGGPVTSWDAWSWRWNPVLAAARGYAVLLPDPALSSGYGLDFIARGWNAWGEAPFTDLMAITDAAVTRPDIDASRTAAMGGSFGGYMANWVAGHTDRFSAIVTHASLWALDQFQGTTDRSDYWDNAFDAEGMAANSPHHSVGQITTPMLVIHGDRDYRVPVAESIRLWSDLAEHHAAPDGTMPHRYLYFPDENHWILSPQNTIIWYETVFAFLAEHLLGEAWARPAHLG